MMNFTEKAAAKTDFFPEDWTASVVRAFNPGREKHYRGRGHNNRRSNYKNLISGEMTCLVKLFGLGGTFGYTGSSDC
ncbi:MAG: hypothetical protein L6V93_03275 [Clostridiales bacterium]|nr:MAG: hypothetical protein L6V93_03275 [Clostridiales bacterium]